MGFGAIGGEFSTRRFHTQNELRNVANVFLSIEPSRRRNETAAVVAPRAFNKVFIFNARFGRSEIVPSGRLLGQGFAWRGK
jgi:hypothetical protein